MDLWLRRIDPDGNAGYDERWLPFYFKVGVELVPKADRGWIGGVGLKVPFYTVQTVDRGNFGGGEVTLNPKPGISPYLEVGYQVKSSSAALYFDSYWFKESNPNGGIFQPDSKAFQIGVRLGWSF
jgi:hypothetical protein